MRYLTARGLPSRVVGRGGRVVRACSGNEERAPTGTFVLVETRSPVVREGELNPTPLRALEPESSASAYSATRALGVSSVSHRVGERLPTCRRLARWMGWIHIRFRGPAVGRRTSASAPHQPRFTPASPAGPPRTAPRIPPSPSSTYQREPVHVSTSYRSRPSPQEGGQGPQSGAGHCGDATSTILLIRSARGSSKRGFPGNFGRGLQWASTSVDRADRGNQPISRRVDTISKQYQGNDEGGGAPWES